MERRTNAQPCRKSTSSAKRKFKNRRKPTLLNSTTVISQRVTNKQHCSSSGNYLIANDPTEADFCDSTLRGGLPPLARLRSSRLLLQLLSYILTFRVISSGVSILFFLARLRLDGDFFRFPLRISWIIVLSMIGDDSPLLLANKQVISLDVPIEDKVPPAPDTQNVETKTKKKKKRYHLKNLPYFCGCSRFLLLVISVASITVTRSNDLTFNFTVICMTSNSSENNDAPLYISPLDSSVIFGASGIGAICALPFAISALHHFGARTVLGVLMLLSSLATLMMPLFVHTNPLTMVPFRAVQGMGIAVVMPVLGYISGQWSPVNEIGNFVTVLSSAGQLSQILTMPLAAQLCVRTGWASVYTTHGVISLAVTVLFVSFFRNDPRSHPCIGEEELFKITRGEKKQTRKERKIPMKSIGQSKAVWAIWIAFIGNTFAFQLIVQFMPTYLNKVMKVGIERTGMAAILPPLSQLVVKVIAGIVSDKISFISERRKLQIFNSIAMCGCGICLLPLGFLEREHKTFALVCFTASISFLGLVACGSLKSSTQIARSFSHMIMGPVQFIICSGMIVVPFVVTSLAPNNEVGEWRLVFFSACVILFATNLAFCLLCSADPEPWAVRQTTSTDADAEADQELQDVLPSAEEEEGTTTTNES